MSLIKDVINNGYDGLLDARSLEMYIKTKWRYLNYEQELAVFKIREWARILDLDRGLGELIALDYIQKIINLNNKFKLNAKR